MTDENYIQPFQFQSSSIRGRIVRLDSILDEILSAHKYPKSVAKLTAETITLCSLLSAMLKYEGVFTLQAQGDGPVKMLVSDITSQGIIRGCASFKKEQSISNDIQPIELLGKGHLAFTVDQGEYSDRYQGIVELKGKDMSECTQHYFAQSEQIDTSIKMAVGEHEGKWCAGAIMLQQMPEDSNVGDGSNDNNNQEDWQRAVILQKSCTQEELLSPDINSSELLFRLFHEEGVRVYETKPLKKGCRCSSERVENILVSMSKEEIEEVQVNGEIEMTCEFCSKTYTFEKINLFRKMRTKRRQEAKEFQK